MEQHILINRASLALTDQRRDGLVRSVAAFLHALLTTRHSASANSYAIDGDPHRLRTFAELVVADGNATFALGLSSMPSVDERRYIETRHRQITKSVETLSAICDSHGTLLSKLCHLATVAPHDDVDLHAVVAFEGKIVVPFFSRLTVDERGDIAVVARASDSEAIRVGGLADALAVRVEVETTRWLIACEDSIDGFIGSTRTDTDADTEFAIADLVRRRTLRARLARMLAQHLAMKNHFEAADASSPLRLVEQPPCASDEKMQELLAEQLDAEEILRCRHRRDDDVRRLRALGELCVEESANSVVFAVDDLVAVLQAPPLALHRQPGYENENYFFERLACVARMATTTTAAVVATQVSEWRNCIGAAALVRLHAFVAQALVDLETWEPPRSGFVPSLRQVRPPLPTWKRRENASESLTSVRRAMAMPDSTIANSTAYLPTGLEASLRLISMIWELFAYPSTSRDFFSRGRLRIGLIGDVAANELVTSTHASWTLCDWQQRLSLGKNYRNSVARLRNYRGDDTNDLEGTLRRAARNLSSFSLAEILAVSSEALSVTFDATRWRLVDATTVAMGREPFYEFVGASTAVVDVALDVAVPILMDMRSEFGLRFSARPSALGDFLRTFKRVRNWKTDDGPLVLTHAEVADAGAEAIEILKELGTEGGILTYGRAPRTKTNGQKRLFTFTTDRLVEALGEDDEEG